VSGAWMYINILLDAVLTNPVKVKRCKQRYLPIKMADQPDLFLAVEQLIVRCLGRPITTKPSMGWSVSQSRHMSAILVSSCRWLHYQWLMVKLLVVCVAWEVNFEVEEWACGTHS